MSVSNRDWCKFFADIEKDPRAVVSGITVRDMHEAKIHANTCDVCYNRCQRVIANLPPQTFMDVMGEN